MPEPLQPAPAPWDRKTVLDPTTLSVLLRQVAESSANVKPTDPTFAAPRPRSALEVMRDVVIGNPQAGETAIGRALGNRYEKAGEQTPSPDLPLVRFETLTPEPGVGSAVAKTATSFTTAPALIAAPMIGAGVSAGLLKTAVGRLASAGIGADMIYRAYEKIPEFKKAVDSGDDGKAREILATGVIDAAVGATALGTSVAGVRIPSIVGTRERNQVAQTLSRAEARAASAATPMEREAAAIQMEQLSGKLNRLEKTAPDPVVTLTSEAGVLRLPDPTAWWEKQETKWIDQFTPLRNMEKAGTLAPGESAYEAARLFAGHFGKVVAKERELRRILRPVASEKLMPELDSFLELERHQELFNRADIGSTYQAVGGRTAAQIDAQLNALRTSLGPQKLAQVERAARQTRMWADNTLREFHESGLIGREAYEAIVENNQRYSPLQRMAYLADEIDKLPTGSRTFNVRKQGIVYQVKGSTEDVLPASEAFLRNAYRMTTLAERNKVTSRIGALAERPEFSSVVRQLRGSMEPGPGEGRITAFRDGVKESFAVPKPVADAVSGMNVRDVDTLGKWIAGTNRAMIEGSTRFYLPFIAKNIWRDFQTATLRSGELKGIGFTPLDWMKGLSSAITRDKYYDAYLRSGAAFSGFFERQASVKASLKRITEPEWKRIGRRLAPWEVMRVLAETSELSPRVGYLRKALNQDFPLEQVGMMTRNATVDFARMGTSMKTLNMWIPFINARLQGTLATGGAIKSNPVRSAAVLTSIMGIPQVATYVHNVTQFPEVWNDIRDSVKYNNFLYIAGDKKDKDGNYPQVFMLPKGDIGRYFGNPLENFMEWYRGEDPKGFAEMSTQLLSDVSPIEFAKKGKLSWQAMVSSVAPPVAKSIIEPIANENLYTGRKIETLAMQGVDPKERYTINTPKWIVKAAQVLPDFLGISPMVLQNFVQTQFGGVGRLASADVGPESNALLERTGIGPAGRAFVGALGGGVDEDRFSRKSKIEREINTDKFKRDRLAQQIYVDTMELAPEKRLQYLSQKIKGGELDAPTMERFIDHVQTGAKGMTPYERSLYYGPLDVRARVMVEEIDLLPDVTKRLGFFKRLTDVGVVNDDVAEKMAEIYLKRGGMQQAKPKTAPQQKKTQDEVESMIRLEAINQGVPPSLAIGVARVESGLNQSAVSPKGAIGVMQLMPKTAATLKVDPHNTQQNISGGITYLKQLLDRYKGDMPKALAAYNAGPGAVDRHRGVPPYKETQNYVKKITGNLESAPEPVARPSRRRRLSEALGIQ